MTDREKLIELISGSGILCEICGENSFQYCAEALVDHILSNGVTFATDTNVGGKWIPVTERLPDKGVIVLVSDGSDYPGTAELVLRAGGRLIWENGNFREVKYITHWMPLPAPPKEE